MIVNNIKESEHVKFISYTGKYPNLCTGVLTLEIDGVEYKFGHNYIRFNYATHSFEDENIPNYDRFWSSGGGISKNYNVYHDEWCINTNAIPEQFKKYVAEIDEVFNENVEYGCCGGCI